MTRGDANTWSKFSDNSPIRCIQIEKNVNVLHIYFTRVCGAIFKGKAKKEWPTLSQCNKCEKIQLNFRNTYRSISLDFMMWFFAAVTFHDPKVKSCLLLLKPCNIIAKRDTNNKTIRWFKNVLVAENKTVLVCYPQMNFFCLCICPGQDQEGMGHPKTGKENIFYLSVVP